MSRREVDTLFSLCNYLQALIMVENKKLIDLIDLFIIALDAACCSRQFDCELFEI